MRLWLPVTCRCLALAMLALSSIAHPASAQPRWRDLIPGLLPWRAMVHDTRRDELVVIAGASSANLQLLRTRIGAGLPWSDEMVGGDAPQGGIAFATYDSTHDRIIAVPEPSYSSASRGFHSVHLLELSGTRSWIRITVGASPRTDFGAHFAYDESTQSLWMQGGSWLEASQYLHRNTIFRCALESGAKWDTVSEPPLPQGQRLLAAWSAVDASWHFFAGQVCIQHAGCTYDETYGRYDSALGTWSIGSGHESGPSPSQVDWMLLDPITSATWLSERLPSDAITGARRAQIWSATGRTFSGWQRLGAPIAHATGHGSLSTPRVFDPGRRLLYARASHVDSGASVVRESLPEGRLAVEVASTPNSPGAFGPYAWFDGRAGTVLALSVLGGARELHRLDRTSDPPAWRRELLPSGGPTSGIVASGYDAIGRRALILDRELRLWALESGPVSRWSEVQTGGVPPDRAVAAAYDAAGRRFVVTTRDRDFGRWSAASTLAMDPAPAWRRIAMLGASPFGTTGVAMALSPDGRRIAALGGIGRITDGTFPSIEQDTLVVGRLGPDTLSWLGQISTLERRTNAQLFFDEAQSRWVFEGGRTTGGESARGWSACPEAPPLSLTEDAFGAWAPETRIGASIVRLPASGAVALFGGLQGERSSFPSSTWLLGSADVAPSTVALSLPEDVELLERPPLSIQLEGPRNAPIHLSWWADGHDPRDSIVTLDENGRSGVRVACDLPSDAAGRVAVHVASRWLEDESTTASADAATVVRVLHVTGRTRSVGPDRVDLEWESSDDTLRTARLRSRSEGGEWRERGTMVRSEHLPFAFRDSLLRPETDHEYELQVDWRGRTRDVGRILTRTTSGPPPIDRPDRVGFARALANPLRSPWIARVQLPEGSRASLELIDLSGRLRLRQDLTGIVAGTHEVPIDVDGGIAPGLYVLRLRDGGVSASRRIVLLP